MIGLDHSHVTLRDCYCTGTGLGSAFECHRTQTKLLVERPLSVSVQMPRPMPECHVIMCQENFSQKATYRNSNNGYPLYNQRIDKKFFKKNIWEGDNR